MFAPSSGSVRACPFLLPLLFTFIACQSTSEPNRNKPLPPSPSSSRSATSLAPVLSSGDYARAAHRYFNGGYGLDAKGNAGPILTKGHSWITKKAVDYLTQKGLLPGPLTKDGALNNLYFGTAFADWQWLGNPEHPNTPIVNHLSASADAYSTVPVATNNCPYNSSCSVSSALNLTRYGGNSFKTLTGLDQMALGGCTDHYDAASFIGGDSVCNAGYSSYNGWTFSESDQADSYAGVYAQLQKHTANMN